MKTKTEVLQQIDKICRTLQKCSEVLNDKIAVLQEKKVNLHTLLENKGMLLGPEQDLIGKKGTLMLDRVRKEEQYQALCKAKENLISGVSDSEIYSLESQIKAIENDSCKIREEISRKEEDVLSKKTEKRHLAQRSEEKEYHRLQEELDDLYKAVYNTLYIRFCQEMKEKMRQSIRAQCEQKCMELIAEMKDEVAHE